MTAPDLRQDQRMDQIMAVLLRSGVLLSASLVFIGGVVYLSRHDLPVINYRASFRGSRRSCALSVAFFARLQNFTGVD